MSELHAPSDLQSILLMLKEMVQDTTRQAAGQAEIRRELQDVVREMNLISRTMRGDGNGERGLVFRMIRMEEKVTTLVEKVEKVDARLETRGIEAEKGRWTMGTSAVVGFLSILGVVAAAIIGALATMLRNRP